eukprot:8773795-Pyramimonas_sp.AAC.1
MSSVAALARVKYRKPRASMKMTKDTNMVANLARLAERVQTSRFNRRARPMILNAIGVLTSSVAVL